MVISTAANVWRCCADIGDSNLLRENREAIIEQASAYLMRRSLPRKLIVIKDLSQRPLSFANTPGGSKGDITAATKICRSGNYMATGDTERIRLVYDVVFTMFT